MSTTQAYYDGKRLIPCLRVEYSRNFDQLQNGEIIGTTYNINFTSKILADKGSPDSFGEFWEFDDYPSDENIASGDRLASILVKQRAIRELFAKTNLGKKFEIIPENQDTADPINSRSMWFYPISAEINFAEGPWFNDCDYTISMVAERVYPNIDGEDEFFVTGVSETWSLDVNEQQYLGHDFQFFNLGGSVTDFVSFNRPFNYRVSHSLSATGKKYYIDGSGNNPLQEAKNWVLARTGVNQDIILGFVNNLSNHEAYNHLITENVDELNGSYSVNETWLFSSGNVIEDYSVSTQAALDGLTRVGIQGNIQGLDLRVLDNVTEHKWDNASGYFDSIQVDLLERAQVYSQISLHPSPVSYVVGRNPIQGTISYNYEYDNRPSNFISGALTERISVSYGNQHNQHAEVPVIGRAIGPVLQGLGTSQAKRKGLSIDFVLGPQVSGGVGTLIASSFEFPYHLISGIVESLNPINNGATKSYNNQPQQNWEPITGAASYSVEWVYE